jgi:Right handed beta helix region
MFYRVRAFLLSLTIIAVLVFSAVGTTVAYADGGTTPDQPPAETTTEEAESGTVEIIDEPETVATEAPVDEPENPAPIEALEAPVQEKATPAPAEAASPVKNKKKKTVSPAPILNSIPGNTSVAVLDAKGQSQPLASQAAAQAIEGSTDPIWCPEGQAPTPGANGCTQSFNSFTALLTFLAGNASFSGPGIIYIQQGAYQGGESTINFNNFNLSNISNSNLTITGGWNTATGTTESTSTFNNVSLIVGNSGNPWGGALTLNNITITNPAQTGINLNSNSNISLTNVNVTNSTNGAGAELTAGGNVTIRRSTFERNKTAGAIIRAVGEVAIAESSFSNPVNARRQIIGLDIVSDGNVSFFQVMATGNRQAGATIDAAGRVSIASSDFSGTMSMMGSQFLGYGLTVVSQNAIDLDGVTANNNFLWGASLTAAGNVNIANSTFNANTTESPGFIDDTGLIVNSGGNVSIFNSHADDNRLIGATITATGNVSISNSTFSSNNGVIVDSAGNPTFYGYGLQVVTGGNISLSGVVASGNTLFGAHLETDGDITISNSEFSNQSSGTATLTGRGLEVIAGGIVFLDNVTLNNNQTFGANIQAGAGVFLNAVTASGNGTNGVEVNTNCGTLFLIGGTYTNNGQYGLSVLSTQITQSVAPTFAGNGAGNIFEDPGTCVFTPTTPPPAPPPAYSPNDPGAVQPYIPGLTSLDRTFSDGSLSLSSAGLTLNSFLASYDSARSGLRIGPFIGNYAYVYLASGIQIVLYAPSTQHELVMNGS